ncbi:bestrophin [Cystoisospora suis]|uniref:Bestrophin n=1 Tax=Cystoisospora suis TaxID=483139 RepID=A0A2C6LB62_9APIC|nr:bestrophin [Cystoisospora suis]
MIHYRQDPWLGFCILLQPHGSVLLCAVPRALIAGLLTWALMAYGVNKREAGGDVMWSPTVFNFFLSLAALVLAFHTNQAYQRFWEARSQDPLLVPSWTSTPGNVGPVFSYRQVQTMASWWADAASSFVVFDEMVGVPTGEFAKGAEWRAKILHLLSLLHAVSIQYLLHNDAERTQLEVLGGMDAFQAKLLSLTDDQTYLVMHWVVQEMMRRIFIEKGLAVPPPFVSRIQQQLSNGMLAFNSACKIEDTPFPFPYVQLVQLMDWVMTIACPVVIASWMIQMPFAIVISVVSVGSFHATFAAACAMESPFGRHSNDLPLVELHRDFVNRLKSIVDTHVAACLNNMILKIEVPDQLDMEGFKDKNRNSRLARLKNRLHRFGGNSAQRSATLLQHPVPTHMKGKPVNPHRAGRGSANRRMSSLAHRTGPLSHIHRLPLHPKFFRRNLQRHNDSGRPHRRLHHEEWEKDWGDTVSDDLDERGSIPASMAPHQQAQGQGWYGCASETDSVRSVAGSAVPLVSRHGSIQNDVSGICSESSPRGPVVQRDKETSVVPGAGGAPSPTVVGAGADGSGTVQGTETPRFPREAADGNAGDGTGTTAAALDSGDGSSDDGRGGTVSAGQQKSRPSVNGGVERKSLEMLCELGPLSRGLSRRLDGRSSTRRMSILKSFSGILRHGSRSGSARDRDLGMEIVVAQASGEKSSVTGGWPAEARIPGKEKHSAGQTDDGFLLFHSLQQRRESDACSSRRPSEAVSGHLLVPSSPVAVSHKGASGAAAAKVGAPETGASGAAQAEKPSRTKSVAERGGTEEAHRARRTLLAFDPHTSPAAMMEEEAVRDLAASAAASQASGSPPPGEVSVGVTDDEGGFGLSDAPPHLESQTVPPSELSRRLSRPDEWTATVESPALDARSSRRPTCISSEEPLPVSGVRRIGGPSHGLSPADLAHKVFASKPSKEREAAE